MRPDRILNCGSESEQNSRAICSSKIAPWNRNREIEKPIFSYFPKIQQKKPSEQVSLLIFLVQSSITNDPESDDTNLTTPYNNVRLRVNHRLKAE